MMIKVQPKFTREIERESAARHELTSLHAISGESDLIAES